MFEECTTKCISRKHADSIFSVFIAAGDEFEDMVMKLLPTCCNIATNKDSSGRTALQVAASLGKMKILHWLFSHDVYVNAKDEESGYSALHRTFYYGQLQAARALLHNNASLFQPLDNDNMSPFDHLIQDRSYLNNKLNVNLPSQVHVWGSNSNFGLGKQQSPEFPELLDVFPKGSGGIKKVVMNKFHTVFLTSSGQAFSCGIGQGGKLGLGTEATVIIPQKISTEAENCLNGKMKKSVVILEAVLGTYHTILLTEGGNVLSFGSNMYHQLGHNPPPNQLIAPKVLSRFEDKSKGVIIKGVSASRFHSVFWCPRSVYTCGLNAGALGHIKGEKTIITPKPVPLLSEENYTITHVAASDGATAIATEGGNVFVLHEFQCRKIASKQYDLLKIVMEGGKLDFSQEDLGVDTSVPFQVLLLTKSGKVYIWSQTHPVLTRCAFRGSPFCIMKDVSLGKNAILLVNREGGAFVGTIGKTFVSKRKTEAYCASQGNVTRMELPKQEQLVRIHIQRIPGIYRATSIVCDPAGQNFAAIQVLPSAEMSDAQISIPPSQFQGDLKQLLQDADPYDLTHDCVFHVGSKIFAGHRFVLSANCNAFYQNVCASSSSFKNDNKTVHITDVPAEVFELILEFIYTGTCDIFEADGWNVTLPSEESLDRHNHAEDVPSFIELKRIRGQGWKSNERDGFSRALRIIKFHAKNLGLRKLAEVLDKAHNANTGFIRNNHSYLQPKQWNRFSGEDFYDTKIVSNDGKEFDAHRAVLIARSDYFRSMFSYVWIESVVSRKIPLPIHSLVLEVILDYFYEDKALKVEKSEDVEWISNCLVSADLLLIPRLVSICESRLVGLLSIKNVGKVLDFATVYNAAQLKISCMHFVCYNLPAVIELRVWNCLSEEVMKELTHFYQQFIPRISCRLPTPSKHLTHDDFNIFTITESLEEVSLTSCNRERDGKRKKMRRKSVKKCSEFKHPHQLQSEPSSQLTVDMNPNIDNTVCLEKEVWSKVDKPKKRNKSLSFETPAQELNPSSSPSKPQIPDTNKVLLGVRLKETGTNIGASSSVNEHDETHAKQNSLTLFEVATIFQATNSPENEKCKKFRKLSQKQRKFQENNSVIATPNTSSSVWKSTLADPQCTDPIDNSKSVICCDDPINSPNKVHSVWGSPDKTKDISKAQISESEEKFVPLQRIIAKERIERQNLIKISTKSLKLTLIEEKAIEDLTKFYGIDQIDDEFILVERVLPLAAAVPIWSGGKVSPLKSKNKLRSFSMSDSGI